MKKGRKWFAVILALAVMCSLFVACSKKAAAPSELDYGDADLSEETAAGLESAAEYRTRYKNGDINIGDVMPYYHDGIYSFFYLAEASNHPVYRVDTTDFVHYEDKGEALSPGASNAQDAMIGTGSIVKAEQDYYFFYTGFKKDNPEAIMLAKSSGNIDNFVKVENFMFTSASVNGCDLEGWDLRDPEAIYDGENERFILLVSARRGGEPVIAEFTVSLDLTSVQYVGVVYSDTRFGANVLECCDLFNIGEKWYLTYSVQDTSNGGNDGENSVEAAVGSQGKVFYAMSDSMNGPFERITDAALDSHAFYAAKSIQDENNTYLAGWIRQKNSNIGWQYMWGGNLQVHQLTQNADGSLNVALPQSVRNYYSVERKLEKALEAYNGFDMFDERKDYHTVSGEYSSYMLHSTVSFDSEVTEFGFALGVSSNVANIMEVAFVPSADKMRSSMAGQQELCSKYIRLIPGEEYDVTLLAEGSAVTVYVNNSVAFTSRIRNIGNKKLAVYALGGSVTMKDFHLYTPSEYSDTLSAGYGNLTVTENGAEQKGNVNRVHIAPSQSAAVEYTLTENNFIRYTIAAYSDKAVRVSVKLGGKAINEYTAAANKILQANASSYAAKGNKLTVEFASDEEADVWINVGVETDKRAFAAVTKADIERSGTASYTAGEGGVYEYTATMYYGGNISGNPVFEAGNSACAQVTENARLVTLRGAVKLNAGETFDAALRYEKFTADIGAHNIVLQIRGGGSNDTYAAGVGTYTKPVAEQCNVTYEIVPAFQNVEFSGEREMSAEMNGSIFGEQGKNGFVYAYGKASDELRALTEYNTNGDESDYKHKAPEINDALEVKADFMKQGGGYVTAVVWVAPADGFIDFVADYTCNSENVQVQALRNRTLLYDEFLKDAGSRTDFTLSGVEVKSGDCMVLAVRTAGRSMGEGDGNYHLKIGKGNSTVPFNPDAPLIADYAADYNTERNGDYGWEYLDIGYTWDNGEHPTTVALLESSAFGWGIGGKGIDKNGVAHGDASVAWRNTTDGALSVSVSGSVSGMGAYVRVWIIRADNSYEKVTDGLVNGTFALPNKGYVMQPDDIIAVMFFDNNGDGCTLDMKVRTTDEIEIDDTALASVIASANAIENTDNRYTAQSFAALKAAITNAENFVRDMADTRKSYSEISAAVQALKAAINGLKLDTSAAKEELNAQLEAAAKFNGKELLGNSSAFGEALAAAQAVAQKQDATSDELVTAANALKTAMESVTVKVADYVTESSRNQGDGGWIYLSTDLDFNDVKELEYAGGRYENGDLYIDGSELRASETNKRFAAIGYRNYTDKPHAYSLYWKAAYIGTGDLAVFAYEFLNADLTKKSISGDWHTFGADITKVEFTLQSGEAFLLVLRYADDKDSKTRLDVLQIGCNDTLIVSKAALQNLITEADGKKESDYTFDSYAALGSAKQSAQTVLENEDASEGEIYRAERALTAAISGLQNLNAITQDDILKPDSGWTVYSAYLNWGVTADKLLYENMQVLTLNSGVWSGSFNDGAYGGEVKAEGDLLRIKTNGRGIAFVFDVPEGGEYELTLTCDGTRGDGRWYVWNEEKQEFEYNDGWIGKTSPKTITVQGGKRIAMQFEGDIDMLFGVSVVPKQSE